MTLLPLLEKIASSDRIGSAYLFTGRNKTALKHQALLFTKRLNCHKHSICNDCRSCKKIDHSTHPDIFKIQSENGSIKIEPLRELQKHLQFKPLEATYKMVILEDAHDLEAASGNAILKIVEEPPPQTIFVLLTPFEEKILQTILSRCQVVRFGQGDSSPLARNDSPARNDEALSILEKFPQNPTDLFELAKEISKDEERFEMLLETWLRWYQALVIYKITGGEIPRPFGARNDIASTRNDMARNERRFTLQQLYARIDAILGAKRSLDFSVNRELLAEHVLLQLKP